MLDPLKIDPLKLEKVMDVMPEICNVPIWFSDDVEVLSQKSIYRYMEYDHLMGMVKSGENVLVNPLRWEDKFEAAVTRVPSTWVDGTSVDVSVISEELFAQCWCMDPVESDMRWKTYKGISGSVRIATTVYKLLESVDAAFPIKSGMRQTTLFGKVHYLSEEDLVAILQEMPLMRVPEVVLPLMLLKRSGYMQEDEHRLVIYNCETSGMDEFRENARVDFPLLRMPLPDPCRFIDQIMLGEDVSVEKEDALHKEVNKAGWTSDIVRGQFGHAPSFQTNY